MATYLEIFDVLQNTDAENRLKVSLWRLAQGILSTPGGGSDKVWADRVIKDIASVNLNRIKVLVFTDPTLDPIAATDSQLQALVDSRKSEIIALGDR